MAIFGRVIQVRRIDDEFQEISIGTKSKSSDDGIKVFGVPNGHAIKAGDEIFLSDRLEFKDTKIIGFSWNSRIFICGWPRKSSICQGRPLEFWLCPSSL